ncbi:helix-turn-helix domain-containing protein [Haloarcula sp. CBA1127]|uniref:helix-turn-helix domain-containing protein n=1 Tax=Haloarcula sp. CBA1127 TaxID=1765055 RepID=UPI00073F2C70|nr:helix-turn-helix domain-containing protein [Haloarcula sp. CBA1127]
MSMLPSENESEGADDGGYVTDDHLLVDVLGGHPKTRILAVFLGNPEMDFNVTEIADYADLKRDTVYKYLDTLRGWGLVEETRRVGNSQMYALNTDSEAAKSLAKAEWKLVELLGQKEEQDQLDEDNNPLP